MSKLISFIEIKKANPATLENKKALVSEVAINSDHVAVIRPNGPLKQKLLDLEAWPPDLDERIGITKIHMALNNSNDFCTIDVLGDLEMIIKKMEIIDE